MLDRALTPHRVAGIWRYAKEAYIDKGTSFEDTLTGVSSDLGIPREWVTHAFTKPKALRAVTNEVFVRQEARRSAIREAKAAVAAADTPGAVKLIGAIVNIPRATLTFGHGPVFPVTHSLDLIFTQYRDYFGGMAKAWQFASKAEHAKAMDMLRHDELYPVARKAGLVIDPEKGPQGVLIGGVAKSSWAMRSWDSLKVTRMEVFRDRWEKVPPGEQSPELAKLIASQVNHSTGVMSPGEWGLGKGDRLLFAPQLTFAKISKTVIDPGKTALTWARMASGHSVPFAERYAAALRTRQAAKYFASFAGLLGVNQGLLMASGSHQRVNVTDPTKSDFLRPKFGGYTLNMRGSAELFRLIGQLVNISQMSRFALGNKSKTDRSRDVVAKYAQYKINPTIQLGTELAMGEDAFGRPTPWSGNPGTLSKPQFTPTEYALTKGPIYLGGATREIYDELRQQGMAPRDITSLLRALAAHPEVAAKGALVGSMEALGGGIGHASEEQPQRHAPRQ
ncbi:MAG: hypothetical protein ACR2ID_10155 [Chthoniobacterales bacterium]